MKRRPLSDDEITAAFGNTDFGSYSDTAFAKRKLLCEALFKVAVGYGCGGTITRIMRDLKLISKSIPARLTTKGQDELKPLFQTIKGFDP